MSIIPLFQTKDGEIFKDHIAARHYDDKLFEAWLESNPLVGMNDFLSSFDDTGNGEQYNLRVVRRYIRGWWDNHVITMPDNIYDLFSKKLTPNDAAELIRWMSTDSTWPEQFRTYISDVFGLDTIEDIDDQHSIQN